MFLHLELPRIKTYHLLFTKFILVFNSIISVITFNLLAYLIVIAAIHLTFINIFLFIFVSLLSFSFTSLRLESTDFRIHLSLILNHFYYASIYFHRYHLKILRDFKDFNYCLSLLDQFIFINSVIFLYATAITHLPFIDTVPFIFFSLLSSFFVFLHWVLLKIEINYLHSIKFTLVSNSNLYPP